MPFQQAHVGDGHAAVHRFAHVVDGEHGDLRRHMRLRASDGIGC